MILKRQSNPSARWNKENDSWWVGESYEYRWTDMKERPVSSWLTLECALQWIIEYDERKVC
jgi:hypothetical protein